MRPENENYFRKKMFSQCASPLVTAEEELL
jgi:hypothetical protein